MSKRSMNTHRRPMRAVTPVGRVGRNAAGAAIAAGILMGGASAANAGGEAPADAHVAKAPQTVEPAAAKTLTIEVPQAKSAAKGQGMTAAQSAAPKVKIAQPEPQVREDDENQADDTQTQTRDDQSQSQRRTSNRTQDRDQSATRGENATGGQGTSRSTTQRSQNSDQAEDQSDSGESQAPQSGNGGSIVNTARNGIGVRYVYGGSTRSGWDCSGFTAWVYAQHGISLPHSASAQRSMGTVVSRSEARPGDLVYTPGHVGIYAGNGRIIDAGTSAGTTSERAMWPASWTFVRIG